LVTRWPRGKGDCDLATPNQKKYSKTTKQEGKKKKKDEENRFFFLFKNS
jgi:hypothetical protein